MKTYFVVITGKGSHGFCTIKSTIRAENIDTAIAIAHKNFHAACSTRGHRAVIECMEIRRENGKTSS